MSKPVEGMNSIEIEKKENGVHCTQMKLNRVYLPSNTQLSSSYVDEQPTASPSSISTIRYTPQTSSRCNQTGETEEEESCYTTSTSQSVMVTRYPARSKQLSVSRGGEKSGELTEVSRTSIQPGNISDMDEVIRGRTREKFELQRLNYRLSSFIERVRILEAQNRTLAKEASNLRGNYTSDISRMRAVYIADVDQLRESLANAEERKAECEVKLRRAECSLSELQKEQTDRDQQVEGNEEKLRRLDQQSKDAEIEVKNLRRECSTLTEERTKDLIEIQNLRKELKINCLENDRLMVAIHAAKNDARMLREEITHQKKIQDAELRELSYMVQRESTQEAITVFRTEIMQVLREIQLEYEQRLEAARKDLHTSYEMKAQTLKSIQSSENKVPDPSREENSRLRSLVVDQRHKLKTLEETSFHLEQSLREARLECAESQKNGEMAQNNLSTDLSSCQSELQSLRVEFEALLDSKLGLELEISSYRRLLEGEERRLSIHAKPVADKIKSELLMSQGEGGGREKLSHSRSSKGYICIIDVAADGSYVTLTNTGSKKEHIGGMQLLRFLEGDLPVTSFTLPDDISLGADSAHRNLKIWSHGKKPSNSDELELSDSEWATGLNMKTVLLTPSGEERATYNLRVLPSQGCPTSNKRSVI